MSTDTGRSAGPCRGAARDRAAVARALARDRQRPLRPSDASHDGRRHRRGRRADDPRRRPLARRLRLVQLPRVRPRPRDHRAVRSSSSAGAPTQLVAAARKPRSLRGDRGAPSMLGSRTRLSADDHAHPHVRDPVLAASGTIFLDAHKTLYDGCQIAKARGAAVRRFRFEDPEHLDQLLTQERDPTRLVPRRRQQHDRQRTRLRGVRRGGAPPRRPALRRRRARVRRDRRAPRSSRAPTRARQQHRPPRRRELRERRARRRFSKAYSSLLAFIACPTDVKDLLKVAAPPYLYSGPRRSRRWRRCSRVRRERGARRRAARTCGSRRTAC